MKEVKMMVLDGCPHCKRAFELMEECITEHPQYREVNIEVIEENREAEKTEGYDYWYVPTFFVADVKIMEGVPNKEGIEAMFQAALAK